MLEQARWQKRLRSNRIAIICLIVLGTITAMSIMAYIFIPDNTVNANRQIPQIALQSPGYKQSFLVMDRDLDVASHGLLYRWIYGISDDQEYVPYDSIEISDLYVTTRFNGVIKEIDRLSLSSFEQKCLIYLLGTDKYGRDVFSRLVLGLRISMIVGLFSVVVSLLIGVLVGSIAAYYGGRIDKYLMLLINTSWSIPTLLLAFAIIIAFGKGFLVIVLAVGLTMWVDVARIVRGQVLQIKNELYVRSAKVLGYNDARTIFRHILPNVLGSVLVMAAANFATAILVEAGLSYLGLGIQPPTPSLGNMLQENYAYATGGFVYLAFFPILTIMTLVLCFNLLGTAMRDVFYIKTKQS